MTQVKAIKHYTNLIITTFGISYTTISLADRCLQPLHLPYTSLINKLFFRHCSPLPQINLHIENIGSSPLLTRSSLKSHHEDVHHLAVTPSVLGEASDGRGGTGVQVQSVSYTSD